MNQRSETPEGFWKDSAGRLVPSASVSEENKLEHDLVTRLCGGALALRQSLTIFKHMALGEAYSFKDLMLEKYDAKKGGEKGNMTLRSFDGTLEVQIAVSETLSFGTELQAAKSLIDECVLHWSEGTNDNLRTVVMHAFQTNKEGRIDTSRVLGLRRLAIDDPKWKRAMDAIGDALRVTGSTTYCRFYHRDPHSGVREAISLDLAKL